MQKTFGDKTIDFSKIPNITDDDIAFLSDMFVRFPRVLEGYHEFTNLPPDHRVYAAAKTLDNQPRTGWEIRFDELPHLARTVFDIYAGECYGPPSLIAEHGGSPKKETVLEHCAEAQELFSLVYAKSVSLNHLQWGMECMKFHDFHEAIDGDFTPHDKLTKAEKKRLEHISTELLCEARHTGNLHTMHVYNCCQLFEGCISDPKSMRDKMLAQIRNQRAEGRIKSHQEPAVKFLDEHYTKSIPFPDPKILQEQLGDIDALHMAIRACRMKKEGHLKPEHVEKLNEFWDYIVKKLKTPQAKAFFEEFHEAYLDKNAPYQYSIIAATEAANFPRR